MSESQSDTKVLLDRAAAGDEQALAELFDRYRHRLKQMVRLRLDGRLRGRVDPSDVVQEAFIDLAAELPAYSRKQNMPLFLWMRVVTGQRLQRTHRQHLGSEMRDAARDVSLFRDNLPAATSASLAAQLLGRLTSATQAAVRAEMQLKLHETLNQMPEVDREIIALRNFEELDNGEAAQVLGLSTSAASKRYVRALKRLQDALGNLPGLFDR